MGLIKTALKTAVAVKTAHFVHDRIQQRQGEKWVAEHPPAAPPTQTTDNRFAQLAQLGELRAAGVLNDAEFESEKARILAS